MTDQANRKARDNLCRNYPILLTSAMTHSAPSSSASESDFPINVCSVRTDAGFQDYVVWIPVETAFKFGLPPQAILGRLSRPLQTGEAITPSIFQSNKAFVVFMHEVIDRLAPTTPSFPLQATSIYKGWLYLIDQRTPTPEGNVPFEDIVGAFEIEDGKVVSGSYQPNPKHRILSANGFVNLGHDLQACLRSELSSLNKST